MTLASATPPTVLVDFRPFGVADGLAFALAAAVLPVFFAAALPGFVVVVVFFSVLVVAAVVDELELAVPWLPIWQAFRTNAPAASVAAMAKCFFFIV